MAEPGYTDVPAVIRVLDGTKLSASKQTEGAVKALLRNGQTNSLETHAEIFLLDASKSALKNLTPRGLAVLGIGTLVAVGATVATVKGIDRIKQRQAEKATTKRVVASTDVDVQDPSEEVAAVEEPVALIFGSEVDIAEEQIVIAMSADDWRELLRRAGMLNSLEERIWMLLSSVRIEGGDEDVLEWQRQMNELTPRQVSEEIRLMIDSHPEMRDNEELGDLLNIFVNGRPNDAEVEPKRLDAE